MTKEQAMAARKREIQRNNEMNNMKMVIPGHSSSTSHSYLNSSVSAAYAAINRV